MTRKSSSGALHITFQSSSSSESSSESESSSSSSSSESSESDTTVSKNQRNNTMACKVSIGKVANIAQTPSPSVKATPAASSSRSPAAGVRGENKQTGVGANRRGRRKRKKTLPTNITVGGDHDVLTTKSTLYKSPVLNKRPPGTSSNLENISATDRTKKTTVTTANTKTGGKETGNPVSQWDVQPTVPAVVGPSIGTAVNSASVSVQSPTAEQLTLHPSRDYSALPQLQGPPRQGDKLAFKVRLSLSFTGNCIVPIFKILILLFSYWKCLQTIHQEYQTTRLVCAYWDR